MPDVIRMPIELPTLRLNLAGFSLDQQELLHRLVSRDSATTLSWEFTKPEDADAFWFNGARTQVLGDGLLRIASGVPAGRSIQIDMSGLNRPAAFAVPTPRQFKPELTFELQPESVAAVLRHFQSVLRPQIAQFCLASQILEQEAALGSGVYQITRDDGTLVAVVDVRGDVGVLPTALAPDFENAMWTPKPRQPDVIPAHFVRCSLSRLMWDYALRTTRDVLPSRYRTDCLYYRRPPRLPQRMLRDSHLLLLRELTTEPGNLAELAQRIGLPELRVAADLAALYLVGAVTSNPRRAAQVASRPSDGLEGAPSTQVSFAASRSDDTSGLGSLLRQQPLSDKTVPAPMTIDY